MRLVWVIIPLVLFGVVGMQQSFAEDYSYDWGKSQIFYDGTIIDSIKVQLENGVEPREIICKNRLYLLYKTSDNSPICVKEYFSAPKLIDRGFATLGETSLLIITDKEVYSSGETITITMKNDGDSLLMFGSAPNFYIRDAFQNSVELPLDTISPPTDRNVGFDTLASTTFVWNQTDRNLIPVKPGIYSVYAGYAAPLTGYDLTQISYEWLEINKTFEIVSDGSFEECVEEGNKVIESFPRECITSDGKHFIEYVGNVVLSTNKQNYRVGEGIYITMKNIGTDDALYAGVPIGFWITDEQDNPVLITQGIFEAVGFLKPHKPITHTWNQKNDQTNMQVDSGMFTITTQWDSTETSHSFTIENCLYGYPDICIPYSPTDLDCDDIEYRNFKVLATFDSHNFDADHDNVGCETD